ncbi:MAG: hypothetical protein JXQ74_01710 [Alphaproteobacteria bacterium]|nr:hypothetical protein [Alphaproteobacteria bacterium]
MKVKIIILFFVLAQSAMAQEKKTVISTGILEYNNSIQIFAFFATDTILGIPFKSPEVNKNDIEIRIKSDSYEIHADYTDRNVYVKILREAYVVSNPFAITVINGFSVEYIDKKDKWHTYKYVIEEDNPLL